MWVSVKCTLRVTTLKLISKRTVFKRYVGCECAYLGVERLLLVGI